MKPRIVFWLGVSLIGLVSGCATDSRFLPSSAAWRESARDAARDPATWIPLAGAAVIAASGSDHHISDWASDKTPVFGSRAGAKDFANYGSDALAVMTVGSLLFSPQQNRDESWWEEKSGRMVVMLAAHGAADGVTGALKPLTGRERPNEANNHSFPSGHATAAFAFASEFRRNLEDYPIEDSTRLMLDIGAYSVASGVAWARVEGKNHYPTDVLVGAGLGNFIASWIYQAFVGDGKRDTDNTLVSVTPVGDTIYLGFSTRF